MVPERPVGRQELFRGDENKPRVFLARDDRPLLFQFRDAPTGIEPVGFGNGVRQFLIARKDEVNKGYRQAERHDDQAAQKNTFSPVRSGLTPR